MIAVDTLFSVESHGQPGLRAHREVDTLTHNAHNREPLSVDLHDLTPNFGIGGVTAFPKPVAENEFLIFPGLPFFWKKIAAQTRLHAERREKIRSYEEILNFLGRAITRKIDAIPGIGPQPVKGTRLLLPFEIGGGCDRTLFNIVARLRVHHRYDAIDLIQRNGMQQEGFRHAEDGGVRAHAQRQRASTHEGREAVLPKHA